MDFNTIISVICIGTTFMTCIVLIKCMCEGLEITWEDVVYTFKMLFPKYKLEQSYKLLEKEYRNLNEKKYKTKKEEENLNEIKKSMDMISLLIAENNHKTKEKEENLYEIKKSLKTISLMATENNTQIIDRE